MATLWELAKLSYQNRDKRKKEEEMHKHPLDKALPLGLHLDGKIEIGALAARVSETLHMKIPGTTHLVQGFSQFKLFGADCFRVLLHSEEGDETSYLLIFQDEKGISVRWFVLESEVFPQSPEEWAFWLAKEDGSIGLSVFETPTEPSPTVYKRLWVPDDKKRIDPVRFEEILYLDRYDASKAVSVRHDCMLYGRKVSGPASNYDELILVSHNRDWKDEGELISVDIGIELVPSVDLKVIY